VWLLFDCTLSGDWGVLRSKLGRILGAGASLVKKEWVKANTMASGVETPEEGASYGGVALPASG